MFCVHLTKHQALFFLRVSLQGKKIIRTRFSSLYPIYWIKLTISIDESTLRRYLNKIDFRTFDLNHDGELHWPRTEDIATFEQFNPNISNSSFEFFLQSINISMGNQVDFIIERFSSLKLRFHSYRFRISLKGTKKRRIINAMKNNIHELILTPCFTNGFGQRGWKQDQKLRRITSKATSIFLSKAMSYPID